MGIRQFLSVTHCLSVTLLASIVAPLAVAQVPFHLVSVPDGGAGGRMESIFVPPKPGAPFSLTLHTEWSRPMGNGGTVTVTNTRHIVRDSKGRIYQERWGLVPKGGTIKSEMDIFQITDPNQHTWFNCMTFTKVCDLYRYHLSAEEKFLPSTGSTGPLPDGSGFSQHEDLGPSDTEGIDTHHYRESITINAGVVGNDQPMVTRREFWYSPHLAINLISIVDIPETGKQIFTAKEISTAEPDPAFFEIPAEYKVVDRLNEQQ